MGRKTIPLYAENSDLEARILAGLRADPSPLADDTSFDHLGDLGKAVIKLGSQAEKASDKKEGTKPSPRSVVQYKILDAIETMILTSIQVARQEVVQDVMTMLGSSVGAATVSYDAAQANALAKHDEMIELLLDSCQAVDTYRKNMGPQNHTRDGKVAECERMWNFSTASYVTQALLEDEKSIN